MSSSLWTPNELYHYGIKGMKWDHHRYKPVEYTDQNGQRKIDVKEAYRLGDKPIVTKTTTYNTGDAKRISSNPIERVADKANYAVSSLNNAVDTANAKWEQNQKLRGMGLPVEEYTKEQGYQDIVNLAKEDYKKKVEETEPAKKEKTKYEFNRTNIRDVSNSVINSGKSKIYSLFGKKYTPKASGSNLSEINNEVARRSTPQGPKKKLNQGLRSTRTSR